MFLNICSANPFHSGFLMKHRLASTFREATSDSFWIRCLSDEMSAAILVKVMNYPYLGSSSSLNMPNTEAHLSSSAIEFIWRKNANDQGKELAGKGIFLAPERRVIARELIKI